jgi:ubiquinone/menaquinone biosynthesis C-methylase UbiE
MQQLLHQDLQTDVSPIPPLLNGCTVLNLGCKNGRDAFVCSAFVGEEGQVIGVDPSEHLIEEAVNFREYHQSLFGYSRSNTQFLVSNFDKIPLEDGSVDVIMFNNLLSRLQPDERKKLLEEAHRVLKEGGELFFSDGSSKVRIPTWIQNDPNVWKEQVKGALYTEDLRRTMSAVGFMDVRVVETAKISSVDPETEAKMKSIGLSTNTFRAFKLSGLEDRWEYYGQEAIYKGTIEGQESLFVLDSDHIFLPGQPTPICGNTALMLSNSRFAPYFSVSEPLEHQGLFQVSVF